MQSEPGSQLMPRVDLVYSKTATGRQEVGTRAAGLNARQRAALIMLDGQREASVLASVMPADQVGPVLAALIAQGLIAAPAAAVITRVVAAAPVVAAPQATALAAIKDELIAAAEACLGVMAADVVARVRQAQDAVQLLRVLGQWHMAMQDSKHGKVTATALLEKTKATLHGAAPA